jgi:hypothetical protein
VQVSQHGTHEDYIKRFREVKRLVWRWREDNPGIQIKIRQSHRGWMQQYNFENGKPVPFRSEPAAAYRVCMQKTSSWQSVSNKTVGNSGNRCSKKPLVTSIS